MVDKIYKDVRTNAIVRVVKQINSHTVMVMRLHDKVRYIADICNLKVVGFSK